MVSNAVKPIAILSDKDSGYDHHDDGNHGVLNHGPLNVGEHLYYHEAVGGYANYANYAPNQHYHDLLNLGPLHEGEHIGWGGHYGVG
jgi:hypothetical protein